MFTSRLIVTVCFWLTGTVVVTAAHFQMLADGTSGFISAQFAP